jgi:hypothetical protein
MTNVSRCVIFGILVVSVAFDVILISNVRVWKFGGSVGPWLPKVPALIGLAKGGSFNPEPFGDGRTCRKLVFGHGPNLIPVVALSAPRTIVLP